MKLKRFVVNTFVVGLGSFFGCLVVCSFGLPVKDQVIIGVVTTLCVSTYMSFFKITNLGYLVKKSLVKFADILFYFMMSAISLKFAFNNAEYRHLALAAAAMALGRTAFGVVSIVKDFNKNQRLIFAQNQTLSLIKAQSGLIKDFSNILDPLHRIDKDLLNALKLVSDQFVLLDNRIQVLEGADKSGVA